MAEIEALGRQIGEQFGAERVILFGSYARGTAGPDSDVDLLVVMPAQTPTRRLAAAMRASVAPPFALDILVRTAEAIHQRAVTGDGFWQEVLQQGRILHGPPNRGMGSQG